MGVLPPRRLRHALLPGISCYGSAHGLAQFYAALVAGKLVPLALLAQAQVLSSSGHDSGGVPVRYGLGFQLGSCGANWRCYRRRPCSHIISAP